MSLKLSGLASGMDTESIVKQLMDAEKMKKTKVENKKIKLEWTKEKWKGLNTKLYSFYTDNVSKMRLSGTYNVKKASISDSSVASISAKSNAVNGNYTLKVNRIATSNYVTSGKLNLASATDGSKVTAQTKISELAGGDSMVGQEIEISYDGKVRKLDITNDTTVAEYVKAFGQIGLSASFDEEQQRIFTSASKSGAQSNFSLSISSQSKVDSRDVLREYVGYDSLTQEKKDEFESYLIDIERNAVGSEKYNKILSEIQTMASGRATNTAVADAVASYKNAPAGNSLAAVGMTNIINGDKDSNAPADMAVVKGVDSEIVLNGAVLTGASSVVKANGLEIDLKSVTGDNEISFSVSSDNDSVYNTIKDFLSEYNSVLDEMNKSYRAASSKGYDPLTDEQKEAMSEDEIEKWETKIKDSLLRRDSTLDGIISSMKNAMMTTTVEVDGKKYSLASLGIMTSKDYTENGLLHIYGDEDDTTYADQPDKLRALLDKDPELVTKIMTGITGKLYEEMNKKMGTSTLSSALTFYNDKQMDKQLKNYEEDISKWDTYLQKMEDRYYKQFTAMEKAMTKMNQSQASLAQMLGGGGSQ